jgi:pimeloyl-ACP methyl ester carboxylesterase
MKTMTSSPVTLAPAQLGRRKSGFGFWIRRVLLGLLALLVGLALLGAIYQAIATASDQRTYPPPGQLVDVGGYTLHLNVQGQTTGQPTVILEAGMASFSSNWHWVQTELAHDTRVVAYDRAGLGWSDAAAEIHDAQQSARDLHIALQQVRISGPYVLAGHSYGGLVMRAFADLYPDEVVGMVLVDASHPDQWAHIPTSNGGRTVATANRITSYLTWVGVVRLLKLTASVTDGLPARPVAEMKAILAQPRSWMASSAVLGVWDARTRPQINNARSLGALPLAVLSVTEQALYAERLTQLQAALPALSSNSMHLTVQGATHENVIAKRENAMIVVGAIRRVIESAQTGEPLRHGNQPAD